MTASGLRAGPGRCGVVGRPGVGTAGVADPASRDRAHDPGSRRQASPSRTTTAPLRWGGRRSGLCSDDYRAVARGGTALWPGLSCESLQSGVCSWGAE